MRLALQEIETAETCRTPLVFLTNLRWNYITLLAVSLDYEGHLKPPRTG